MRVLPIVASMLACECPKIHASIRLSAMKLPNSVAKALFSKLPLCSGATTAIVGRWCVTTTIRSAVLSATLRLIKSRNFSCSALKSAGVKRRPLYRICRKSFIPRCTKYSSSGRMCDQRVERMKSTLSILTTLFW